MHRPIERRPGTGEGRLVPALLWTVALAFLTLFLFVPLAAVFTQAFAEGMAVYWRAVTEPEALSAIRLTLLTAVCVVPLNLVFGGGGVDDRAVRLPRQTGARHPDRPAVCGVAGRIGARLRPPVRGAGFLRTVARRARHPDHLRGAR